jgi:pyruvate/2-oxoglutarate/acetoin dehydrogenase E1 component
MRVISYTQALREALDQEMARDSKVFLLGEDIGKYGGAFGVTGGLLKKFGAERVINTPISEPGFVGVAIGAALTGSRPVAEIMFMDFMTLAMDQLVNQAAKLHYVLGDQASCPMVLRTPGGAGRRYGPTHSQTFASWLVNVPGLKVVMPSTPADAKGLLKTAIRDNNPVVFIEHKRLYNSKGPVPLKSRPIPFGKARVVRKGKDVTIVAWSWMVHESEIAADILAGHGIDAEVIDMRTLCPMDIDTVAASVKETGRLVIVDEEYASCGVSAEIGMRVSETIYDYMDAPIVRVTTPHVPIPASPVLEDAAVPSSSDIVDAVIRQS